MSVKANYFKLGLFVVGAVVAGIIVIVVIGSGRWFQPRLSIETYFNESVQGLDVGSKLKYRGVEIGQVTRIGFTYNKYQQDRPMQHDRTDPQRPEVPERRRHRTPAVRCRRARRPRGRLPAWPRRSARRSS